MKLTLKNGWVIDKCLEKLKFKYLYTTNSLIFDYYAQYHQNRNEIGVLDALITQTMNSAIDYDTAIKIGNKTIILDFEETKLEEADLDIGGDLRNQLVKAIKMIQGKIYSKNSTSFAQVCKLLALKRPALFPMIDRIVAYYITNDWKTKIRYKLTKSKLTKPKINKHVSDFIIEGMKIIACEINEAKGLERLQKEINCELAPFDIKLSKVRILDNLIWFDGHDTWEPPKKENKKKRPYLIKAGWYHNKEEDVITISDSDYNKLEEDFFKADDVMESLRKIASMHN